MAHRAALGWPDRSGERQHLPARRAGPQLDGAILWHGGEEAVARDKFRSLSAAARTELLKFLRSL